MSSEVRLEEGRIPAGTARVLAKARKRSIDQLMIELLPLAREYARPPLSNFRVGAIALGASGALYPGANLEIGGNGLNQTVHAEQSALANAFAHEEQGITAIAVTAAPCGHCRQFLNEIENASRIRIIVEGREPQTLASLLPESFGPSDLGIPHGLFTARPKSLRLVSGRRNALVLAALAAASRSYAPYTNALSGCAIRTKSRRVYTGSYLENAAFNPSLSPLQSALVNLIFAGEEFRNITRVALVEMREATISHRAAAESVLRVIAPGVGVEWVACEGAARRSSAG